MSNDTFARKELLAAYICSLFEDGDRVFIGANLEVPRAAAILAHLTHGPNIKYSVGLVTTNLLNEPRLEPTKFSTDHRVSRWAEAYVIHNEIFDRPQFVADVFCGGGIQIDMYGNTNLIGIKGSDRRFSFRGPGSFGTTSMTYYAARYFLYATTHTPQLFVPKADYISTFGYGDGGDHRQRLGLDRFNDGPNRVITPLAIMDFETPDHRMQLRSVHPGVSVEDVVEATGFDLVVPPAVPTTPGPTAAQLLLLRERIDVEGLLADEVAVQ